MMMCVWWFVVCISCNLVGGILDIGGGWEYSCNGVLLFSASVSSICLSVFGGLLVHFDL